MLFIFFLDAPAYLPGLLIIILGIVIYCFWDKVLKFLLFLLMSPLIIYCTIRWAILKLLESYGIVEEKPRKVVDIKGLPDFEMALIISVIIGLLLVFLGNKACS